MLEGIIIRAYPYGEADLILKVISASSGKVSLLAKHARKSKRRFSGGLDLFDQGRFEFKKGRGSLATLTSFNSERSYLQLRENLDKFSAASFICECFDHLVPEESHESVDLFELFKLSLSSLAQAQDTHQILRACFSTLASLLKISGILDLSLELKPGVKAFAHLVQTTEEHSGKNLVTYPELQNLLAKLVKDESGRRAGFAAASKEDKT